jgi:hypothetical protein
MKISIVFLFILPVAVLLSCKKDEQTTTGVFDYHAHVYSPDATEKHLGDNLHIDIEFESHTGAEVHHVNVRIFNAATQAEVYNLPVDPHVDTEVSYTYQDDLVLSAANGFAEGDWVLQAKVWGALDGEEEEVSTVNFHISN